MIDLFALGFHAIFQTYRLLLLFPGTAAGIVVGCIPGFPITMGAALVLPLTFGMTSIQGLAAMFGILVGGLADRQITGILLGIPGTPSSVATVFDGPPMALGVPGDAVSAIMMGALILHGIQPGPLLIIEFPPAPAILGIILGPIGETDLLRALMTDNDLTIFITRPISLLFLVLALFSLIYPFFQTYRRKHLRKNYPSLP